MKLYVITICSLLLCSMNSLSAQVITVTETPSQIAETPITSIHFEETEFDFGVIETGEKVRYSYKFTNTGSEPLIISSAKGSCGCTVPAWPKEPIFPGETSQIEVEFDSKGKKGKQSKRVTITANTNPAQSFLTIKGTLIESSKDIEIEDIAIDIEEEETEETTKPEFKTQDFSPADCFAIYPNPTSEVLNLDIKEHIGQSAIVNIYSQAGQLMTSKTIESVTKSVTTFDVSQYVPGMYYATIKIGKEKPSTKCFIIAKR